MPISVTNVCFSNLYFFFFGYYCGGCGCSDWFRVRWMWWLVLRLVDVVVGAFFDFFNRGGLSIIEFMNTRPKRFIFEIRLRIKHEK